MSATMPPEISWADFEKVLVVAGTVTRVEPFPEARKPAWKVWVDFGPYGEKKTSAQIAALYQAADLLGRQVVGVINFPRALPDTRLLWGGRISVLNRSPRGVQRLLTRDLLRVFPQLAGVRIEHAWSGLMSYARHQMPQIGGSDDGLWWAQAFGGHGLAPTCAAGELLAAAIADGDDGWKRFADYGLGNTHRPFGYLAAQASYWWQQGRDCLKTRLEG